MSKDWVQELETILARLRAEDGCPWDREQTHDSLKQYLMEESAELFDAIDDQDDRAMADELGDVLLQVVFHCQIAREEDRFDLQEVARVCCEKMIRRHPHVFGETEVEDAAGVLRQWQEIKREERSGEGEDALRERTLSGVPRNLPALARAHKMQKKEARVGFDWPSIDGVVAKIDEELAEVKESLAEGASSDEVASEIGDVLFSVVNLSRSLEHVAEECLTRTVRKFERRFGRIEDWLAAEGRTVDQCTLGELDRLWERAKREERGRDDSDQGFVGENSEGPTS